MLSRSFQPLLPDESVNWSGNPDACREVEGLRRGVMLTENGPNPGRFSVGGATQERWNVEMIWTGRAGD